MQNLLFVLLSDMEPIEFLLVWGIGILISCVILSITIQTAIRVNKRDAYMHAQLKILVMIAEKQGVDKNEIAKVVSKEPIKIIIKSDKS